MRIIRVALIGTGFMGRAHAMAFLAASRTFDFDAEIRLEIVADIDLDGAARLAKSFGFARWTDNWHDAVKEPAIDLVVITTPNILHAPIALEAIAAGKAVCCEKPLATTVEDAVRMTSAAEAAKVVTSVGFTYCFNPMIALARDIVASGEIGEITAFRGIHAEDFMSSPDAPFNWRCEVDNAGGALADLGSHIIALAQHVVGDVTSVYGDLVTNHPRRRTPNGEDRLVEVDDQASALVKFACGATGTFSASWLATGRKMGLAFEIDGTKGGLRFDQERLNELQLYEPQTPGRSGFRTICAGPEHRDYGAFCPAPGHQLGYNDLKTIEAKSVILAMLGRDSDCKTFADAVIVERIADAVRQSARTGGWVDVSRG